MIYDVSGGNPTKASITDLLVAGDAITDGTNLGSGADVFILAQNGVAQFRSILSGSAGVVINTDPNDVIIALNPVLDALSNQIPGVGCFLVGDGTQWATKSATEVKATLSYGSAADHDATDFLATLGGTMSGDIDMGTHSITGLRDPVADQDAATKHYVDSTVSAGTLAGNGLTKTGTVIDVVSSDNSITVSPDSISINTTFTDGRYPLKTDLASSTAGVEGAKLTGTSIKAALGNAITVEAALAYLNSHFTLPKLMVDLSAVWKLDVGVPNVNSNVVRDSSVAVMVSGSDSAIYADLMIPPNFDITTDITFYANVAKSTADAGNAIFGVSYQYQRPGVAPLNYPSRGPGPNWDFTAQDQTMLTASDDLIHTLSWTIPAGTFQPLDTVSIRLSRLGSLGTDTYTHDVNIFTTIISQ